MAIVIPYTKQTWIDNNGANPLSAARMGVIEEGILDSSLAPAVRVFHNAAQATTTSVALALAFNSERYDQAGGVASTQHDTVTNNSRLTALYAGIYSIKGNAEFAANTTGIRELYIRLNGVTIIGFHTINAGVAGANQVHVSTDYSLAVNDYVELVALQNSGGNLNVNSQTNYSPEFMMVRVA
jgi:hypothetical protein